MKGIDRKYVKEERYGRKVDDKGEGNVGKKRKRRRRDREKVKET